MTTFLHKRKKVPSGITLNQRAFTVVFGIIILLMINYNNHVLNHSTLNKNEILFEMKKLSSSGISHGHNDRTNAMVVKNITDQDSVILKVNEVTTKTKIVPSQPSSKRKPMLVIHVGPNKSGERNTLLAR